MSLIFAMLVIVTSELFIPEEKVEEFLAIVNAGLEISRSFTGNQSFDIYQEADQQGNILFIERWETKAHFQKYYQWRLERGDFDTLGSYFSAPPVIRFYENGMQE